MIGFNFNYYKSETYEEAVSTFLYLSSRGKNPIYYNGGTEIITFARANSIYTDAVIDIKGIPECNVMEIREGNLILGASLVLSSAADANYFPLLSKVSRDIADRTSRNKITLGGNICSKLIYKEAVLPFLIADSLIVTAGKNGVKTRPICQVFNKTLELQPEEILLQIITRAEYIDLPNFHIKKTRLPKIEYPIMTLAALEKDGAIRFALSGIGEFPFRSEAMEAALNNRELPLMARVDAAIGNMPVPARSNLFASDEYRELLLKNALINAINYLGETI